MRGAICAHDVSDETATVNLPIDLSPLYPGLWCTTRAGNDNVVACIAFSIDTSLVSESFQTTKANMLLLDQPHRYNGNVALGRM